MKTDPKDLLRRVWRLFQTSSRCKYCISPLSELAFETCHAKEWRKLRSEVETMLSKEPN